jgi:hypothetical protein
VLEEDKSKAADSMMRAIEAELAQKRVLWQRQREKQRALRVLSFSFLSLLVLGVLLAVLFFFSHDDEMRGPRVPSAPASRTRVP